MLHRHGWVVTLQAMCLLCLAAFGGCGQSTEATVPNSAKLFLKAQQLKAAGKTEEAIGVLGESIAAQPMLFAYRERAEMLARLGRDEEAIKDCEAALALDPESPDATILWVKGELGKPKDKRFQGQFKDPPLAKR